MEIKESEPKKEWPRLVELMQRKYGRAKDFSYFISDVKSAFDFCLDNKNISFKSVSANNGGELAGHIALIKDRRLPPQEAFFGFMEAENDQETFKSLWRELIVIAKKDGISLIKGPVDGSVWHQYRLIRESDGSDFFKSEMMCESYYYTFLKSLGPDSEIGYYSACRRRFDAIINAGRSSHEKLSAGGFSIIEAGDTGLKSLSAIASLLRKVFSKNWGFTDLTAEEFSSLYSEKKLESHLNRLYLVYDKKELIGFASTLKEDGETLIFKTICILPEYHGLGLGNALAFRVHFDAERDGIKKIIYALVKEDNNIRNFPKDDTVIFRRYATLEFKI